MNPLLLNQHRWRRPGALRRYDVPVPTEVPSTDAVFMVLRRMRGPLIIMVAVFTITVIGLVAIPATDAQGRAYRMSVFDAFYFVSYTATTIGFGETPDPFNHAQRMWVTAAIYASVITWTYAVGTLLGLMQDATFRDALATGRFKRRVRSIKEPFHILVGYGQTGRYIAQIMAREGRRLVVVDRNREKVESLEAAQFAIDVPGITADGATPQVLGLAGLSNPYCSGVLAMSGDDATNLSIVMMGNLLGGDAPVIARAHRRDTVASMKEFSPRAVINPYDRFGEYLVLALRRPATYQLVNWLLSPPGTALPSRRSGLWEGHWMTVADDQFGQELSADLRAAGLDVTVHSPDDGLPDVTGLRGFVAGTSQDTLNLTLAAHARLNNPDAFLSVRQQNIARTPVLEAFGPDAAFFPTDLVARECVARIVTPAYWSALERLRRLEDDEAAALVDELVQRCGQRAPRSQRLRLDHASAPAVTSWFAQGRPLRLGDLLRYSDMREKELPLRTLALVREGETLLLPADDVELLPDDELIMVGRSKGLRALSATVHYPTALTYVVTGEQSPSTWVGRMVARRRHGRVP